MQLRHSNETKRKAPAEPERKSSLRRSNSTDRIRSSLEDLQMAPKKMLHVLIMDDLSLQIKTVADEFSKNVDEKFFNLYFAFHGVEAVDTFKKLIDTYDGDFIVVADFEMVTYAEKFLKYRKPVDIHDMNDPHNGGHAICQMYHAFDEKKAKRPELGKLHFVCHSGTDIKYIKASLEKNAVSPRLIPEFRAYLKKEDGSPRMVSAAMKDMGYESYLVESHKTGPKCLEFFAKVQERDRKDIRTHMLQSKAQIHQPQPGPSIKLA